MSEDLNSCGLAADAAAFLDEALPSDERKDFVTHLAFCHSCASLIEALAEDEKLRERPLESAEQEQVASIVRAAEEKMQGRLASGAGESGRGG